MIAVIEHYSVLKKTCNKLLTKIISFNILSNQMR